MKLRNKKTGEIIEGEFWLAEIKDGMRNLRKKLKTDDDIDEWEEYEKPEVRWCIGNSGLVHKEKTNLHSEAREVIGNSFGTEKEARQAVEKLKAWKRLKDKGLKANRTEISGDSFICEFILPDHSDYSRSIDDFELALGLEYEK